jgi:hypothetical protein
MNPANALSIGKGVDHMSSILLSVQLSSSTSANRKNQMNPANALSIGNRFDYTLFYKCESNKPNEKLASQLQERRGRGGNI